MNLPEMTVEKRESTTAHGLEAPNTDKEHLTWELEKAIIMNHDAASWTNWTTRTLEMLEDYINDSSIIFEATGIHFIDGDSLAQSVERVLKLHSWEEVSKEVQDDDCDWFFNLARRYCQEQKQVHKRSKDFIDGSGIGYLKKYLRDLDPSLQRAFDAKWFYKQERPLVFAHEELGLDLSGIANWIHPGHWTYPAGHGTKFLQAFKTLDDIYHLDHFCKLDIITAACVGSMGRTGSLIHYGQDNLAGWALVK